MKICCFYCFISNYLWVRILGKRHRSVVVVYLLFYIKHYIWYHIFCMSLRWLVGLSVGFQQDDTKNTFYTQHFSTTLGRRFGFWINAEIQMYKKLILMKCSGVNVAVVFEWECFETSWILIWRSKNPDLADFDMFYVLLDLAWVKEM